MEMTMMTRPKLSLDRVLQNDLEIIDIDIYPLDFDTPLERQERIRVGYWLIHAES